MASVCGASLALFDAGVPMATATAGVACGLVTQSGFQDNGSFPSYKILTDISVSVHNCTVSGRVLHSRVLRMLLVTWTSKWQEQELELPASRYCC